MFIVCVVYPKALLQFSRPLYSLLRASVSMSAPCAAFGNTDSPGWVHRHASTELSASACMDLKAVLEVAVLSKLELMSLYSETQTPKSPQA